MLYIFFVCVCGVDFGIFNFIVGWLRLGYLILLVLEDGKLMLFLVVFFNVEENFVSFGWVGFWEYFDGCEGWLMCLFKSLLGSSLIDGCIDVQGIVIGFCDLLICFIVIVKVWVEMQGGCVFEQVVLGWLVFFVDVDVVVDCLVEMILVDIVRIVGFKEVSFQYEFIVVVFYYEIVFVYEEVVFVVDIGGGIFDFFIVCFLLEWVKVVEWGSDVLVNGGVYVGGIDFDKQLSFVVVMFLLGYCS